MPFEKFYPLVSCIDELHKRIIEKYKFIQLRIKDKTNVELEQIIDEAVKLAKKSNVKLIINDYVELAKKFDADGVHLGLDDMDIDKARDILGHEKIIGATTNTFEHILMVNKKVDYIGLGPYRFTTTKKNLSPILGDNTKEIVMKCKELKIVTPIYLIGGIVRNDISNILAMGMGVAGKTLFENGIVEEI